MQMVEDWGAVSDKCHSMRLQQKPCTAEQIHHLHWLCARSSCMLSLANMLR